MNKTGLSELNDNARKRREAKALPAPPAFLSDDALLTAREAAAYRRQGVSTFWRDVRAGRLPRPLYVTPKAPRWRLRDLRAAEVAA